MYSNILEATPPIYTTSDNTNSLTALIVLISIFLILSVIHLFIFLFLFFHISAMRDNSDEKLKLTKKQTSAEDERLKIEKQRLQIEFERLNLERLKQNLPSCTTINTSIETTDKNEDNKTL